MPPLFARLALPLLARQARPLTPQGMRRAQDGILLSLLRRLAPLPVGAAGHFGRLLAAHDPLAAFRAEVPVGDYASHRILLDRVWTGESDVMFPGRPVALAQTSGTTGGGAGERFVPQSRALLDHHARGGKAALARVLAAAGPQVLAGRLLMMGGGTTLERNPHGVPWGDLSGIVVSRIPWWLSGAYEPGRAIALEGDWERKLALMTERCAGRDVRLVSGIPSWQMVLFERLCAARGVAAVRAVWPRLRAVIHGGHAVGPFLAQYARHLDPATWLCEVYPASEGFIAVGSRAWRLDEGGPPPLALLCEHGVFLEFLPDDGPCEGGRAVGPCAIEEGRVYRVLLTTPGGLVRYQLGDLVRGVAPGLVRFAGRVKTRISMFGEHVEGDALAAACTAACRATGAAVRHYTVAPLPPSSGEPRGRHEWWIEFDGPAPDPAAFADSLDRSLQEQVIDYRAHRAGDVQMLPPQVVAVAPGTFERWLAGRGKAGGQHKVPQAWPDRSLVDELMHRGLAPPA